MAPFDFGALRAPTLRANGIFPVFPNRDRSFRSTPEETTMRILAFAASLRKASLNRKLIALAAEIARREGADVDLAEFREFEMPVYDGDLDAAQGLPPGALARARCRGAGSPRTSSLRPPRRWAGSGGSGRPASRSRAAGRSSSRTCS